MNKILVLAPHEDRSGRACALAGQLAAKTGASIKLLRVLEEKLGSGAPRDTSEAQQKMRNLLVEVEAQRLEDLGTRLRSAGTEISVEVCWGVVWEAVLDRVYRDGYDLVVKPANGLDRRGHVFFGATALHLFRRCPCPVWVVGDEGRLPDRLLAAIDPSGPTHRRWVASRILDWAEQVGQWSDAEVHVGTAWNAAGEEMLRERLSEIECKRYVDATRRQVSEDLDRVLSARAPEIADDRVHLVHGIAHEALPQLIESQESDLIVMGTLGREGAVGDQLGETAETMIREVRCSVLTIPPGIRPDPRDSAASLEAP